MVVVGRNVCAVLLDIEKSSGVLRITGGPKAFYFDIKKLKKHRYMVFIIKDGEDAQLFQQLSYRYMEKVP